MKSSRYSAGLIGALVSLLALSTGCTGTDALRTGNTDVTLEIEIINNNTRFDILGFSARLLSLRPYPAGGPADLAQGGLELDLIELNRTVSADEPAVFTVALSSGMWQVKNFNIGEIQIVDTDPVQPPYPPGITCEEFIALYVPTTVTSDEIRMRDDQFGLVLIDIDPDAAPVIRVTIDAAVFIAAIQASLPCTSSCSNGDPWCLTGAPLQFGSFVPQIPVFLTIQ